MRARRVASGLGLVVLAAAAVYVSTLSLGGAAPGSTAAGAGVHAKGSPVVGIHIGDLAPDLIAADDGSEPLLVDLDGTRIEALFGGRFDVGDWVERQITTGRLVEIVQPDGALETVTARGVDPVGRRT